VIPPLEKFIASQAWLDTVGEPLQGLVNSLFTNAGESGKQAKNFLNGTWLGHPLHPLLTDVPVGAWTCTLVLDLASSGNEDLQTAADLTLATGLLAATGAAATGFTDWSDTYGKERKVGLLHGLTMVATVITYSLSLLARLAGARKSGVALASLGYGLLSAGAYVGGDEVYDIGYGVNHTAFDHGPSRFSAVMAEADLKDGTPTKAMAGATPVLLVKRGSDIFALHDTCVHAGCSLAGGTLEDRSIICPCHGSQFDLRDGRVLNGPATMPEPALKVRVRDGQIEVKS
jgi:nitrite reductase/ring-hydroxylating ferredoxin subunit/uncharacterized membrane protein